jgi:ubiquinone/menaquinone biosynthesis C-methylase UbiE
MTSKDLFSKHAEDYAKFRPHYPAELFKYLSTLTNEHDLAWDVGTGNGQAAVELAKHYQQIIATDLSQKQIASAAAHPKIKYEICKAEASTLPDHCADLITVAQALHWFDQSAFHAEVRRVSKKSGAVLAIWGYVVTRITPEIDRIVDDYYENSIGKYWEPEREIVASHYQILKFPFEEMESPKFAMTATWSLQHFIGYLNTWSATQKAIQVLGRNPLEDFIPKLEAAWGSAAQQIARWQLAPRIFKIK